MFETKYNKEVVEFALSTTISSKDQVIRTLSEQVKYLESELRIQRQRADLAVDALLASKGAPVVMPEKFSLPTPEERSAQRARAEAAAAALKSELELVGDTGAAPGEPIDGKAPAHVEEIV